MYSREQAEKVSDSLLEPSKRELADRQTRLARRESQRERMRMSPMIPASIAAAVTLATLDIFAREAYSFFAGALAGWAAARLLGGSGRPDSSDS